MRVSFSANDPSGSLGKKIKLGFSRFLTQEAACARALGLFSQCFRSDLDQDISSLRSPPGGNSMFILPQSRGLMGGISSQAGNALWNLSITLLPSFPGFKFIFLSNDTLEGRESQSFGCWVQSQPPTPCDAAGSSLQGEAPKSDAKLGGSPEPVSSVWEQCKPNFQVLCSL